jgi:hypothetical protein
MAIISQASSNQEGKFGRGSTDFLVNFPSESGQWVIPDLAPTWDNFLNEAVQPRSGLSIPYVMTPSAAKLSASVVASSILLLCGNSHATRIKDPGEVYVEIIQGRQSLTSHMEAVTEQSAVEKILRIKHLFSLTGEKLANAMQVSRSAIYNWLDEIHSMKPDNERRLEKLGSLSELWESKFVQPLGRIKGLSRKLKDQFHIALAKEDLGEAEALIQTMKEAEAPSRKRKTVLDLISEGKLESLPEDISKSRIRSRTSSASPWDDND